MNHISRLIYIFMLVSTQDFPLRDHLREDTEDRSVLERLQRYCARRVFASERLEWESGSACDGYIAGERARHQRPVEPGGVSTFVVVDIEQLLRRLLHLRDSWSSESKFPSRQNPAVPGRAK